MLDFLGDLRRTHMCGELRASDAGSRVVLMGWVNKRRDLGSIVFIDLRDRSGVTQVVMNRESNAASHDKAEALRSEYVIAVIGTVKLRDANTINKAKRPSNNSLLVKIKPSASKIIGGIEGTIQ